MMRTKSIWVMCALALVACGARNEGPAAVPSPVPDSARADASSYLRSGDIVRLQIWREPDLSGEFAVDEGGRVVFPKIGEMAVTQVPTDSLRTRVLNAYRRYLRNPSIEITFLRRVNVLGAVRAPGLFPIDPTMTVADALAMAGGTMAYGAPNEIQLFRGGRMITANVTQSTRIEDLEMRSGDQLFVPERSWISRNAGVITAAVSTAANVFISLLSIGLSQGWF